MKALVLCGGMPQLYLIQQLKNRNIQAIVADMNPKAPAVEYADKFYPVSTLDYKGIKDIAIREKVDFLISVCADQMLLIVASISEELGLPCYLDYATAKNVSDKEKMKKIFVDNGIPTSKHIVRKVLDLNDVDQMNFPLVVKPIDTYSSKGVTKVENCDGLKKAFDKAVEISRNKTAIVEEFFSGSELSVDLYVENGIAKLLCIRELDKIPGSNGFIICRGRYPASISSDVTKRIQSIAQTIADSFSLKNTPMLIQLLVNGDDISVIEFCARTGGGIKYRLIPEITGFDVVSAVLDLTLGDKPHYETKMLQKMIVDEFIYCKPGVFHHLEGFNELLSEGLIDHYEQYKARGHVFSSINSSGDRVAYFSVSDNSFDKLRQKHSIANNRIRAFDEDGNDLIRHDIIRLD